MRYSPSRNIERDTYSSFQYIPTPNAKNVSGHIINGIKAGFRSFNIIGTYGTGKSSFLMAFQENLQANQNILFDKNNSWKETDQFEFLNIVGDYISFQQLIRNKLRFDNKRNFFNSFDEYYKSKHSIHSHLFIVIDEFGKVLEHAANNNPEEELYFIQQFAEYINDPQKNIILLTTLHQNFNSYAYSLNISQKNEWEKVKGRFKEIVFNEPVEQLLFLASSFLKENKTITSIKNSNTQELYDLAFNTGFINHTVALTKELSDNIYPMDLFSAYVLTLAIQRYGQNERSLFSFLESEDQNSLNNFEISGNETYNIASVYDYIEYNFYSYLTEVNKDSSSWSILKLSIEKAEALFDGELIVSACKIIKTIGLLNIFAKAGSRLDREFLETYSKLALGIDNVDEILNKLIQFKIIRYAIYKSQFILFEGTDLDIEVELLEAGTSLRKDTDFFGKLKSYFEFAFIQAKAASYERGTPRFFKYIISDTIFSETPTEEVDGYVNLLFSNTLTQQEVINHSKQEENAIIYAYYTNSDQIQNLIFEIDKYQYVLDYKIDKEDFVAKRELEKGKQYLINELRNLVISSLFAQESKVKWFFQENQITILNSTILNKTLSKICDEIYSSTPIFKSELLNKYKLNSTMSTARKNFLMKLLENPGLKDLGIEKFPPEKAIYRMMLANTGIHRQENEQDGYLFYPPNENSFIPLWQASEDFFEATKNKIRKISDLIQILSKAPFKLKPGFSETWVVAYLIIKKEDFALYSGGKYVPFITKEVLELMLRGLSDFSIKAFDVKGVRLDLFNKYREVLNLAQKEAIEKTSFIETIRPFITFYNQLPEYAKNTKKLSKNAIDFREVLAKATDPEDTFFVDLPNSLGFLDTDLLNNPHLLADFVNILQDSIRELRTCYNELLNRIESYILDTLGIKEKEYDTYKLLIEKRYKDLKEHLLPAKQKAFHSRIMMNMKDRKTWLNSLTFTFLNKPLDALLDGEEEWLFDKLRYAFLELLNYIDIQKMRFDVQDEVFKFDITSIQGGTKNKQIVIPKNKIIEAKKLEEKIKNLLSSDDQLNTYALLKLLENKM